MVSLGLATYVKMWSAKQIHSQSKHIVEQSGDRQVVLNCHREDHFVFFLLQINCFVCALIDLV